MKSRKNSKAAFLAYSAVIFVAAGLHTLILMAQDKKVEIDIGLDREPVWYQQPWVWVVAAAVFILLLVAMLRGGKKQ